MYNNKKVNNGLQSQNDNLYPNLANVQQSTEGNILSNLNELNDQIIKKIDDINKNNQNKQIYMRKDFTINNKKKDENTNKEIIIKPNEPNIKKEEVKKIPYIIEKEKSKFDEQTQVSFNEELFEKPNKVFKNEEVQSDEADEDLFVNEDLNTPSIIKKEDKNKFRSIENLYIKSNKKSLIQKEKDSSINNVNNPPPKIKNLAQMSNTLNKKFTGENKSNILLDCQNKSNSRKHNKNYSIKSKYRPQNLQNAMEILLDFGSGNDN